MRWSRQALRRLQQRTEPMTSARLGEAAHKSPWCTPAEAKFPMETNDGERRDRGRNRGAVGGGGYGDGGWFGI